MEKSLNDLFLAQLQDTYFAEKLIYKTLPQLAEVTKLPELSEAFNNHREETQGQIERLEKIFEMIGKQPQAKTCEAIKGIIAEGDETMKEFGDSPALDTALIAAGQAVEHYEMARYGALIGWAKQLKLSEAESLLSETLEEEMKADELLTEIGASVADAEAAA